MRTLLRNWQLLPCKGGGADAGGGGKPKRANASTVKPKATRTNTNQADKAPWKEPPERKTVVFYQGKRIQGTIGPGGGVDWSIDGEFSKKGQPSIPAQELKDMKRAWQEYVKSPNANRLFKVTVLDFDGKGDTRLKLYQKFGFKISQRATRYEPAELEFDNRR